MNFTELRKADFIKRSQIVTIGDEISYHFEFMLIVLPGHFGLHPS